MTTWLITAEIVYQGRKASTNFEVEADTEDEALHKAQHQLEQDGVAILAIDARAVGIE